MTATLATLLGAALWIATGPTLGPGSLAHGCLFVLLVVMPLASQLRGQLTGAAPRWLPIAQPVAAALVLAAFLVAPGPLAGALAAPWLLLALAVAVDGLRRRQPRTDPSLLAAHGFLPVGAAWLLLDRLGVAPPGLAPATALRAAVHFHASGVVLQLVIAATRRQHAVPRLIRFGAIAGIPLIAAGTLAHAPPVKAVGVAAMVASTLGLAVITTALARRTREPTPRALLLVSAASLAVAMVLAAVYQLGLVSERPMAATHGLLQAVGFGLGGLLGHLRLAQAGLRAATTFATRCGSTDCTSKPHSRTSPARSSSR